jgi:O6-methylguanine-DNA--protein-cysteine methyltransferase
MNAIQYEECIEKGLRRTPRIDEFIEIVYGSAGKPLTYEEQLPRILGGLQYTKNDNQPKILAAMLEIPSGHLISYGSLAKQVNDKHGSKY